MKKIKVFTRDLIQVSRLTKTKNKKIRIFTAGLISNLIVLMDVLIILSFTHVFTDEVSFKNNFATFTCLVNSISFFWLRKIFSKEKII